MKKTTFLTFVGDQCGKAEKEINFYTSIFPNLQAYLPTAINLAKNYNTQVSETN